MVEFHSIPGDFRILNLRWFGESDNSKGLLRYERYEVAVLMEDTFIVLHYFAEASGVQIRRYENLFVFLREWSSF